MGLRCKRCGSEEQVKNGLMRSKQRYRCKACGLNFTDTPARGKPLAMKATAVLLYVSGLSMNRTAKLVKVSTPTIQAWLGQFAAAYAQKPEPEGRTVVIELDEMWHYLKKLGQQSRLSRLSFQAVEVGFGIATKSRAARPAPACRSSSTRPAVACHSVRVAPASPAGRHLRPAVANAGDQPHRPPQHQRRRRPLAPARPPLVVPVRPERLLQVVVRPRQVRAV